MPNASVLPVPVRAWPIRSVPIRATERVISWMGKGVTMPARSSASQISGSTPSSRKVVVRILPFYGCGPRALARRSSVGSCFGSPAVSGVNTPFPVSTLGPLRSKVVPRAPGVCLSPIGSLRT